MGRKKAVMPSYRLHKATGRAVVTIGGKDVYLGQYGTVESRLRYSNVVAEFTVTGRVPDPGPPEPAETTVSDVIAAYWLHAEGYYLKHGKPTAELHAVKTVLRPVRSLFGDEPATAFGPVKLKEIRRRWIKAGHTRGTINRNAQRIVRVFRWAASEELIPASVPQALATVPGLRRGRTEAKESQPVRPVDLGTVERTIAHLCPVVADMVRVQLLTGARPGEVCAMKPGNIDRTGDVWEYRPPGHKMEHHDRERVVFIGPGAQAILTPYLLRGADDCLFRPVDAVKQQREAKHARRRTPGNAGNRPGHCSSGLAGKAAKWRPGEAYDANGYRSAIHRACDAAFPAPEGITGEELKAWQSDHRWSPNRLRHTKATEIRKRFGLDAAQVILGHAFADVTQIYAERDADKAREVARAIG